ncbi:MAG: hypothetical protein Q8M05_16380 [Rhodoferax sp.]|uniref:hypothetical protein n=1 Tax=Rhodoferax sp. TaxID=50421 RepID=UPI002730229F|nr:hypothetical protein [Rhodoferax sp.]MDP1530955.1 hypothetical protein [Rhodoferax sp.]MDP1942579.1 hypothetical protein [Rhodoferax sp.]MDP3193231.1 hypothetical protein [Rhodoferax sp.]MDP3337285.1 hypothetical protein [Rhodoferax sp.]MDP3865280.1 hypothetical protein [Rhodoferax sp.]
MKRVRWLNARWPVSMRTLGAKMKTQLFTPESFDGFVIERIRDSSIEAHFIEKLTYQETMTDPFGREEVIDRVSYRDVDFTLFADFPNIEIRNSQRSTKEFVNKLLELCNFSLTVTPVSVNLLDWITAIQGQIQEKLLVDSLQISGLELEEGVSAKVLLKGDRDVREALQHLSVRKKFTLEKVQVKMSMGHQTVPVHLANSGSVKIPVDYFNDLVPILRNTLPSPPA